MHKVAIIGAGPVGLDAALALGRAGIEFHLLESDEGPAANVRRWGAARLELPWSRLLSSRMRRDLRSPGRELPDGDVRPTARAFAELLDQVAEIPLIRPHLLYRHRVVAVGREGLLPHEEVGSDARAARPFRLLVETPDGQGALLARAVIDCTGAFAHPLPLGPAGIPAAGEGELGDVIERYPPSDEAVAGGWAGEEILLVGDTRAARAAAGRLAELVREHPETRVVWAVRQASSEWLSGDGELAALGAGEVERFTVLPGTVVAALEPGESGAGAQVALLHDDGLASLGEVHRVVSLTGWDGDPELTAALDVARCPVTGATRGIAAALREGEAARADDPTAELDAFVDADALVGREPSFYTLGERSFGRRDDFRVDMGYRQVDLLAQLMPGREIPDWGRNV